MSTGIGRPSAYAVVCAIALLGAPPVFVHGGPEPKLTVSAPVDGGWIGSKYVVKGTLHGAPRGSTVHVGTESATVADDGSFTLTITAETEGQRTIRVIHEPADGQPIIEVRRVTVDTQPPTIDSLSPAAGSSTVVGDEATIAGHVLDAAPVELRVNGRKVRVAANGRFETMFVMPAEGELVLTFEVSDAAGNAAPRVVRTLRRWVDRGPPVLSFEADGVYWIARDGARLVLGGDAAIDARTIGDHESTTGPLGTLGEFRLAGIRASGVVPSSRFLIGWRALTRLKGDPFVVAPAPDPSTSSVQADRIDFLPTAEGDGSWRVRVGSKDWVIFADDVRDCADFDRPIPQAMVAVVDEVAAELKATRKFAVVRLRVADPIPRRLLESIWLAGHVHAKSDVILERLGPLVVEKPPAAPDAPATPAPPPVDRARLEAALLSADAALAVRAAKELADGRCVEAIPALRVALEKAGAGPVRGAAGIALGKMNDLDSIPALIELLRTPDGDLAADADTALAQMSGLGRVLKAATPIEQRVPIAERYARWWKGAEAGLRKKKADATPSIPGAPKPNDPKAK